MEKRVKRERTRNDAKPDSEDWGTVTEYGEPLQARLRSRDESPGGRQLRNEWQRKGKQREPIHFRNRPGNGGEMLYIVSGQVYT